MSEQEPIKRFTYRDSTKVLYKLATGVTLIFILIIFRQRAIHFASLPIEQTVIRFLLACSVPISILTRLYFWIRPRIYSVYELYPDSVVRVFKSQRESFLFSEIAAIKISSFSPRFLGGFTLKMKSGQKLLFLSALKHSFFILESICEARPGLVEANRLQRYLQTSRLVDVSWKRMKEKLSNWKLLMAKAVLLPIGLATLQPLLSSSQENQSMILNWSEWVVLAAAFVVAVEAVLNSFEEGLALKTVDWDADKEKFQRNLPKEKKIAQIFSGLFFVITALLFWVATQVF